MPEASKFSEILQKAMNQYLNGMLTNEQVIEEMLNLAKQIQAAQKEGEKLFAKDNFGVGVLRSRYLKRENYTFVGIEYEQQNMPYRDYGIKLKDALLQVGYMHPILSDNGKNVFLYGDVSALGGYEELNEDKELLPNGATLLDRSRFVYGGAVHGSVEVFLTDRLLFLVKAQGRFLFGTDVHHFRPALSAGFRFNF